MKSKTVGSDGWLSLSGATNGSAAAGEAIEIAVTLRSPPDGKSIGTVTVEPDSGAGKITITANLDEAPLVDVWFTDASGNRLNRLCVGDRVYMLALVNDPDGAGSARRPGLHSRQAFAIPESTPTVASACHSMCDPSVLCN